tara:strand:+ start:457 stop:711 length:255 start_codon:yes stop_codon:yes gene_type:complete
MTKEQKIPKWFNGQIYKKGGIVHNRFSNEEYKLNNIELSMYDYVMGATIMIEMGFHHDSLLKQHRKGLDWFRQYNPEAYMVLLD